MNTSLRQALFRLLLPFMGCLPFGLSGCAQVAATPAIAPAPAEKRAPAVGFGGGMTGGINPENMLMTLDEAVGLTPEQKIKARAILQREADALNALAPADRFEKGMPFRQAGRDELRALLTPEQKKRQDTLRKISQAQEAEERAFVTAALRSSPGVAARVGEVSSLSFLSSSTDLSDTGRRGRFTYTVIGSTASATFRVFWEKLPAGGAMKIVGIEDKDGLPVQP